MRPHDANARASVRSPAGRTHAATVTSLLGTPGFQPPGLMEMRMRHAAAFAGEPARLFDIHPAVSAVSPRQDALHPRRRLRPADRGLRPRAAAAEVPRARRRPRRRRDPLRRQGQPGARGRRGGGRRSAATSTAPRAARSTSACRSASPPDRIAFGNTIKQASDIAHAHAAGVRAVRRRRRGGAATRSPRHAPGARVILRMLVEVERGRLAAQPQVRLLAPRGAAADGPRPRPRARRRRHLVPRRAARCASRRCGRRRSTPRSRSGRTAAAAGHALAHPQHRRRLPGLLRPAAAGDRGLCRRR